MKNLIFVDCEASGRCPGLGELTEFGAVSYTSKQKFHGLLVESQLDKTETKYRKKIYGRKYDPVKIFTDFEAWINGVVDGRPLFVSDNPAFDWQWVNYGFWHHLGRNPFGHSARRIGDFYAGLTGDFNNSSKWKKLRITKHDHNPVHDALGNVEAFDRILKGER